MVNKFIYLYFGCTLSHEGEKTYRTKVQNTQKQWE